MGFLDQLLKKETRKIISSVMDGVVDNVVDTIKDSMNSNQASSTEKKVSTSPAASAATDPDEEDCCYEASVVCERIEKVAAEEWSGYELRKHVPASEMGASEKARDYSYGLYLNGVPKAMIIIIDVPSHYQKKDVRLAHEACRNQNVFCMNLMLHLPNRRSYISKRLRDNVAK